MYTCTFLITVHEEILPKLTSYVNLFFTLIVFGLNFKWNKYEKIALYRIVLFVLNCNF